MNETFNNKNENQLLNKSNQSEKDDNFINNNVNLHEIISESEKKDEEKNLETVNTLNEAKRHQLNEEKLVKSNKIHYTEKKEFDKFKLNEMKRMNNYDEKYSNYINKNNIKSNDKNYNLEDININKTMSSNEKLTMINNETYFLSNYNLIKEEHVKNEFLKKRFFSDYKDSSLKNKPSLLSDNTNNYKNDRNIIIDYKEKKYNKQDVILIDKDKLVNDKNSANSIKINNKNPEGEMEYPNNKVVKNCEKNKNDSNNQNDSINIDIFYSSKSEKSLDDSEDNSSYDSVEEFYENICQSDVPLDFYKKFLNTKNSINFLESDYYLDSKNDATEEISILNSYIKYITENSPGSSSTDIDNKLINILSLSFLTFIDHVIYDSHIYALKNEFLQEEEIIKTNNENELNSNNYQKVENLNNIIPENNDKIKDRINDSNEKNNIINEIAFGSKFEASTINSGILNDSNIKEKLKEISNIKESNNIGEKKGKSVSMIYNPDIINICLTNLYNQKLVNNIIDKQNNNNKEVLKINKNIGLSKNENLISKNEDITITNKNTEYIKICENNLGNNKIVEKEIFEPKSNIKEKTNETKKYINFNKNEDSLQTNLKDKLLQRKIIIKKINDKIKKTNNNIRNFINYQKYSLEDLFEN